MVREKLFNLIAKYAIFVYGLIFAGASWLFFKTDYFQLHYSTNALYRATHNIEKMGHSRLSGNEMQLNNPVMITLLVIGVVLGAFLIIQKRTNMIAHIGALLLFMGAVIPLLPPYDENLITRMLLAIGLISFAAIVQFILIFNHNADPTPI